MDDDTQATDTNTGDQLNPDDNAPDPGTPPVFSENVTDTPNGGDEGDLDESFPVAGNNEAATNNGETTDASGTDLSASDTGANTELI